MKPIIKDINDLSDSQEMLAAKPNPFVPIFIYILLAIIITSLTWTYFGEIDQVVKADGVVRPNEKVSSIMSKVVGKVDKVYYKAGQMVKRGDVLFTLDRSDLILQKEALLDEINRAKREYTLLKKFKQSVLDNKNYFSLGSEHEDYYYNQFAKYQLDYQKLKIDLARAEKDSEYNHLLFGNKLAETKEMINNLTLLEQSIIDGVNYFVNDNYNPEFVNRYNEYKIKLQQYQQVIEQRKKEYDISNSLGNNVIPKIDIENDKQQYELALLDLENYKNNYLLNIRSNIEELKKQVAELEVNYKKASQVVKINDDGEEVVDNSKYTEILLEKFQTDKIVFINEQLKALDEKIRNIEKQIESIEIGINDRIITAPIGGYVNVSIDLNEGDLVTAGTEILKIIPESDSEYKVIISVLNKDISKIKVGDEINYHFLALPYKEYGEIKGKIKKISVDSIVNTQNGLSYYIVEATIDSKPLYSYKGQEAQIKVGMVSEAYIITDSKKILYYLLEKIDLRD
ncbi:hypothetical protein BHF71_10445 [Vulcanibacillus modesticaldus]|uniref:Uncharacterized protein n=1 Tax=Vulcanibacillus modesticaldus TaxID=337097 RepID=A0A1D2YTG3_9BACI|nr:HlyD family efflux transporter periplasmic adaptor subunit [Vulcanibacillus modesticaldus]OEF98970.1 hypothetical protein BHF71_10445 [Vulcanibacillus modesticaldus]